MRFIQTALWAGALIFGAEAEAAGVIENPQPNAVESGITAITGWNCQAGQITISIDNGTPIVVPYGSLRGDTAQVCGGKVDTGFSYLLNYNTLSVGQHTVRAFADGALFDTVTFTVINLGSEFLTGKSGEYWLNNFPDYGTRTRVTWQQSKQNFAITATDTMVGALDGTYFGGITVTNSGCATPSNNGTFAEFDRFTVSFGANSALQIVTLNPSNITCTYNGTAFYTPNGGDLVVFNGAFSCGTGAQGVWTSDRMVFDPLGMLGNLSLRYTVGETCNAAARVGGARLP